MSVLSLRLAEQRYDNDKYFSIAARVKTKPNPTSFKFKLTQGRDTKGDFKNSTDGYTNLSVPAEDSGIVIYECEVKFDEDITKISVPHAARKNGGVTIAEDYPPSQWFDGKEVDIVVLYRKGLFITFIDSWYVTRHHLDYKGVSPLLYMRMEDDVEDVTEIAYKYYDEIW